MTDIQVKRCKICGEIKPISEFYKKRDCALGVTPECKICRCLKDGFTPRTFREKLPEGLKRCKHCQRVLPETPEYFSRNAHCHNGLFAICKECRANKRNAEYQKSPEMRVQTIQRSKDWRKRNPDKRQAQVWIQNRRRRARRAQSTGKHTAADVRNQYNAQQGRCYWCDVLVGDIYHVDHVIPLSRGGSDGRENIVISCPFCNVSRGDKLPSEWGKGGKLL